MEKLDKNEILKLNNAIENASSIVITGHQNPDADCLGAGLGLFHFLKNKKNTFIILPNRYPANLEWMPGHNDVIIYRENKTMADELLASADLIFSVDYNSLGRSGEMASSIENSSAQKVIIDHHPQPDNVFDIVFSDTSVSSASELVYTIIEELNSDAILKESFDTLFAGLMADTGCFSYNSSNPDTYNVVGKMLENGVNKDETKDLLFDNFSAERMKLMGYLLNEKMKVFSQYGAAYMLLTKKEKEKYNYQIGDSEGFVNLPLSIKGIYFSVFIMEHDGLVKLSLRSKGNFDVNKIARAYFNGGGHVNAAGGRDFERNIDEVEKLLLEILPQLNKN